MTILHAQPYDLAATGFYFESANDYARKAATLRNAYGQPVDQFLIQFIDGERLDLELFEALRIGRPDVADYFEATLNWSNDQKVRAIIAVREVGYSFRLGHDDPDRFDIDR